MDLEIHQTIFVEKMTGKYEPKLKEVKQWKEEHVKDYSKHFKPLAFL